MYRNAEHYPDPTAGAALAHIIHEERMARRKAAEAKKQAEEQKKAAAKREKDRQQREKRKLKRESSAQQTETVWMKAWPKDSPETVRPRKESRR